MRLRQAARVDRRLPCLLDRQSPVLASPNGMKPVHAVSRRIASRRRLAPVALAATAGWLAEMARGRSFSYRSPWSVLSASSVLSIASAASLLSIGSFASILSIGSSNSILSIGSDGGFLCIGRSGRSR